MIIDVRNNIKSKARQVSKILAEIILKPYKEVENT